MRSASEDGLLFEATRYVLEEMSPLEREAFELCLADDQSTREALAEAVWLCQAVIAAAPEAQFPEARCTEPAPSIAAGPLNRASHWAAAGAMIALAASIVLAVVAGFGRSVRNPTVASIDVDAGRQLAVAWVNAPIMAELDDDAPYEASNELGDQLGDQSGESEAASTHVSPANDADWLLEALTASRSPETRSPEARLPGVSEPTGAATRGEG